MGKLRYVWAVGLVALVGGGGFAAFHAGAYSAILGSGSTDCAAYGDGWFAPNDGDATVRIRFDAAPRDLRLRICVAENHQKVADLIVDLAEASSAVHAIHVSKGFADYDREGLDLSVPGGPVRVHVESVDRIHEIQWVSELEAGSCQARRAEVNVHFPQGPEHGWLGIDSACATASPASSAQGAPVPSAGLDGPGAGTGLAAATLLGGLLVLGRPRARWLVLALFSRLTGPKVLDHEVRSQIHELIRADPGIHASELARRLELAFGNLSHHLRVLERERLVTSVGFLGWSHYFSRGRYAPAEMRRLIALREERLRRLYDAVVASPGDTLSGFAERLGYSLPRASKAARRLRELGLVEARRHGRVLRLQPAGPAKAAAVP